MRQEVPQANLEPTAHLADLRVQRHPMIQLGVSQRHDLLRAAPHLNKALDQILHIEGGLEVQAQISRTNGSLAETQEGTEVRDRKQIVREEGHGHQTDEGEDQEADL